MDTQKRSGIPLSALNPKFLHTNSTSHTWPFSAIAELIDNAYDPDVKAKQFWIDWTRINGFDCLTFMDNGSGMNRNRMHKMLSFGFSDKQVIKGHIPVGVYGNGFKSGSMRLGKDALVFSKTRDTMSVGLLSQSYLEAIRAQHVMVPIVTFRRVGQNQVEDAASLQAILTHSLFRTESELFSEFRAIRAMGTTGTRIIVWNLRRITNGETEFDFNTNRYDIQILANAYQNTSEKHECEDRSMSVPESEYSLRAYCSILYLKPRMQIVIRGQKVKTQLISKSLAHIAKDYYRPNFLSNRIRITFGYNTKSKEQYGIMMYHKNRLIKAYERVGCQRKADSRGVGVIGVIECNFLQPTHNKQDFDNTDKYRKVMYNLGLKLEDYWNEIRYKRKKENPKCTTPIEETSNYPDQNWVQCDKCLKWRRLPDGIDCSLLPDKWFCRMNPDPQFRSCQAEEEPEDSGDDQRSYPKPYKKQRKNSKIQHENGEQVSATPLLSSERPQEGSLALSLPLGSTCLGSAGLSPVTDTMPISTSSFRSRLKQKLALYTVMNTSMETDVMDLASSSSSPPAPPPPPLQIPAYTWTDDKPIFRMTERRKEEEMEATSEEQVEFWQEEEALVELTDTETATAAVEETLEQGLQDWYLLETQQQQDQLMELMQATAQERDGYKEQVHQLQKEVMEITCKCEALETKNNESKELRKRLESAEAEKCSLSSQCEQLQRELEELRRERGRGTQIGSVSSTSWGVVQNGARSPTFGGVVRNGAGNPIIGESWQRLRNLRRSIGRLLVTFVPSLDLNQVNYDTGVIDEILDQVLDEVT